MPGAGLHHQAKVSRGADPERTEDKGEISQTMAAPIITTAMHSMLENPATVATPSLGLLEFNDGPFQSHSQVVMGLYEKIALLEQRLAEPNKRQREIEALLGVIWEAFEATNSPQAKPGPGLHRMVSEMLPGNTSGNQWYCLHRKDFQQTLPSSGKEQGRSFERETTMGRLNGDQAKMTLQHSNLQVPRDQIYNSFRTDFPALYDSFPDLDTFSANVADSSGFDMVDSGYEQYVRTSSRSSTEVPP